MTTTELAAKFGIKVPTIHKAYYKDGHYRGYVPVGFEKPEVPRCGVKQYIWEIKDEL